MSRKRMAWMVLLILLCSLGWVGYRAARRSTLNHDLILASATGDLGTARVLLEQGANPNIIENSTQRSGWEHFLDLLFHRPQNSSLVCPLGQAITSGHVEIVRLLLEHRANPNLKFPGSTPFALRAVTTAQEDRILALLLQHGTDPNTVDGVKGSMTPLLMYAIDKEKFSMAQLLLEHGANPDFVNADGDSPLMWATLHENPRTIHLLLSHHADANHKNNRGDNALTYALETGPAQLNIMRILIAAGTDVNATDHQGCTPFLFALANYSPSIELMLAHGADMHKAIPLSAPTQLLTVNTHTAEQDTRIKRTSILAPGATPLMIAVQFHNARLVRLMLAKGADVNARNALGKTALDYADDPEKRAMLQRAGAHR